jgi:hypothetical protein
MHLAVEIRAGVLGSLAHYRQQLEFESILFDQKLAAAAVVVPRPWRRFWRREAAA